MPRIYDVQTIAPRRVKDFSSSNLYSVAQMCNSTNQQGFALRSSKRSKSGLQSLNHEAAFSVWTATQTANAAFSLAAIKRKKPLKLTLQRLIDSQALWPE
jgi:hypothetical protein